MSEGGSEKILLKGPAKAFRNSFGEQVFHFACHAAVPVVLSPDLLHLLRINFFLDPPESLPYVAESQILLSPLCNEVGSGLYEIPPAIRDSLLHELAGNPAYGEARIREIAILLFEYSERFSPWKDNLMIERAQQLTALNFLDPESAKNWLESAEQQPELKTANDREWFIAMRSELRKIDALLSSAEEHEVAARAETLDNKDVSPFGLQLLHSFHAHDTPVGRFAWSTDGGQLATPSADRTVKIWDIKTGQLIRTLSGHTERVICVAWSPRGDTLASGSDDQTAKIWDTKSGRLIENIRYGSSSVASVAWSPDGRTLALGFNDSTVLLWQKGRVIGTRRTLGMMTSLKWSPDGSQLAAASEDEALVEVWNPKRPLIAPRTLQHKAPVLALDWSSNGRLIATGCNDNTVWLWEGVNDNPRSILVGHTGIVNAVSFSPDGRLLASKSHDGTVRLWRTDSGELVSVLSDQGSHFIVAGIAFNPRRLQLATLSQQDTVINIWQVDLVRLLTRAIEIADTSFATTKIMLLGPTGVGKTTIARALGTSYSSAITPDQISLAELLTVHLPASIRRETFLWDLGLLDPLRTKIDLYDTDIVLLLFNVWNSETSLDEMQRYWNAVRRGRRRGVRSLWIGVNRGTDRDEQVIVKLRSRIGRQHRDYWFVNITDESQTAELIERLKLEISESALRRQVDIRNFNIVENHISKLTQQASTLYAGFNTLLKSLSEGRKFSERELRRCLWHLDRSGTIRVLRRSSNEEIAWLQPANVNKLLGLIIDKARTHWAPGRIEERQLTNLIHEDRHLKKLSPEAAEILLDCTANLLVDREICSRVGGELVFSELALQRKPQSETAYHEQQSAFDQLLAWLNPDREIAAKRYEEIRTSLIKMFSWRGMPDPEGLADETFDLITKKVDAIAPNFVGNPAFYFSGVARNMIREYARRNLSLPIEALSESQIYEPPDSSIEPPDSSIELEHDCLDKCLAKLSTENREFILAYYAESKQVKSRARRQLAEELGLALPALRVMAHRIRSQLQKCIRNCLAEKASPF